jgi:hypothetical protein
MWKPHPLTYVPGMQCNARPPHPNNKTNPNAAERERKNISLHSFLRRFVRNLRIILPVTYKQLGWTDFLYWPTGRPDGER